MYTRLGGAKKIFTFWFACDTTRRRPLLTPELQPDVFNEVSCALYNNYWLNVNYRNADGKAKEKTVTPLGLAQHGSQLYLVCFTGCNGNELIPCLVVHKWIG